MNADNSVSHHFKIEVNANKSVSYYLKIEMNVDRFVSHHFKIKMNAFKYIIQYFKNIALTITFNGWCNATGGLPVIVKLLTI